MCHDAVEVLHKMIPDNHCAWCSSFSLTRGTKRAIITPYRSGAVCRTGKKQTATGGVFHMATDWEPYAEHMLEVMSLLTGIKTCQRAMITYRVRHPSGDEI